MTNSTDKYLLIQAKEVAIKAAYMAGDKLRTYFDVAVDIDDKGSNGDLVTEVDLKAEKIIITEIAASFPTHRIHSEEAGDNGIESDWLWLIDPLDGTNNFAIGLPIISVSITLIYRNEPVLGVIYEPLVNRLYWTTKNGGAYCNGNKLAVNKRENIQKGNIGWIQGHVVQNEAKAVCLRQHIDVSFKRMMRLWAPTIQWCMLAKGDLDGIILYNSEGDDLYSGLLMVKEAGGIVIDFEGNDFVGMNEKPYLIACHPDYKQYFLNVVKDGLNSKVLEG